MVVGNVTEIERYSIHDGLGIRTVVFLKGCPLQCSWCCNPETQINNLEMGWFIDECINCHRCIDACPFNAIEYTENNELITERSICIRECYGKYEEFPCTANCYVQARRVLGKLMTVEDVLELVLKDYKIYQKSKVGSHFLEVSHYCSMNLL